MGFDSSFTNMTLLCTERVLGGKSGRSKTSSEAFAVTQARHAGGQEYSSRRGGGEKWSDAGYVLEESPVRHTDGWNVGVMGKEESKRSSWILT